jgi:hypothetical protein
VRALLSLLLFACGPLPATGGGDLGRSPGVCLEQRDCPDGTLCQPATPGAATGTCKPPSQRHCATCVSDGDCGADGLCFQAPGDSAAACHIDCSLSFLTCPSDYNCSSVLWGDGGMRQVCLPVNNHCLDMNGGSCAAGETQPCTRANSAGTCTGVRACMNGQLGACSAPEPLFLDHCGDPPPAGCSELPSAAALSTPTDCGACGNACPGVSSTTADAACTDATCGISCRGDHYDIDGSAANGCEAADLQAGNHDQTTPSPFPNTSCDDSSSQNSFSGHLLSDTRVHTNPTVSAFNPAAGAAPHWYQVHSSGGLCTDDYSVTLTTTGGPAVPCYAATIITDKITDKVTVTGAGSNTISGSGGSYSDGSTIYFKVEKTCSTMSVGDADVSYTVSYHL